MQSRLKTIPAIRLAAAGIALAALPLSSQAQHYTQTALTSDQAGAPVTDTNLVNPWGLSRSSGGAWWVSDNGTGLSTLYDGTGKIEPLVVKVPPADTTSPTGTPTGTIFNGGPGFPVSGKPSIFLFVTEDGTISGWNPQVDPANAIIAVNEHEKSVFKGATSASIDFYNGKTYQFLYVADFRKGRVQIYGADFKHIPEYEEAFEDDKLPAGYAPFNVQNIGGDIYVTFALQDSAKHDEVDGAGLGYVDVFSPCGRLLRRLEHVSGLNAPWGLALASGDFGIYSHDLLVGQFGSGRILAFDTLTGRYKGELKDAANHPINAPGLWAIAFGNGAGAGPANTLYFTAGTNHEADGLFGSIVAVENTQGNDQ